MMKDVLRLGGFVLCVLLIRWVTDDIPYDFSHMIKLLITAFCIGVTGSLTIDSITDRLEVK